MKNFSTFTKLGLSIYGIAFIIDRFIVDIANYIYIPILATALTLLIVGMRTDKKQEGYK